MNREKIYTIDGDIVKYKEVILNELNLKDLYRVHNNINYDIKMCKEENNRIITRHNELQIELSTVEDCINKLGGTINNEIEVIE